MQTVRGMKAFGSRPSLSWLLAVVAATTMITGSAATEPRPPQPLSTEEIADLIEQLGDDEFAVRQAAAERLVTGGYAAREALGEVADGPDPEVRANARRLMTLIDETEFHRRLAEFEDDVDGHRGISLPGWEEFRDLVGSDPAARTLFVDMQRAEGPLLAEFFNHDAHNGLKSVEARLEQLMSWRATGRPGAAASSRGTCATMFFLSALPEGTLSESATSSVAQLALTPSAAEGLIEKRSDDAMRRLVAKWIVECPNRQSHSLHQRLDLIMRFDLAEALPLARSIALGEAEMLAAQPAQRALAALLIGKLGSDRDIPSLEPLLEDKSDYILQPVANLPQGQLHSVQVRDVALAALLHLTNQEPVAYGYLHARPSTALVFEPASLGMENNSQRESAIAKWRSWRAARPSAAVGSR